PYQVVIAGKGQTLPAGACGALTLVEQDQYGNPATGVQQTMNLFSNPIAGWAYYATSTCAGGPVTTATIAAGSTQVSLYFKGSAVGTYAISEDPASAVLGDSGTETITFGTPVELRFTSAAQSGVIANACSAAVTLA